MGYIDAEDNDDRGFLVIVAKMIEAVPDSVRELAIMRVDNWFDCKWLRFSGNGRKPFDSIFDEHAGVVLTEFSQQKLTFPPFTPKRIVNQTIWTPAGYPPSSRLIHPRILRHSSYNLHRRMADFSDSMVAIWFSSCTAENGQGSVMQYTSHDGTLGAWYVSLRVKDMVWRLHLAKGIDRGQVDALLIDEDAPRSGRRNNQ